MVKIPTSRIGIIESDQGFTLLEVLIVICIAGLASAAFAISLSATLRRSKLQTVSLELEDEFSQSASYARQTGRDQVIYIRQSRDAAVVIAGRKIIRIGPPLAIAWTAARETGTSGDLAAIVFFGAGGSSGGKLKVSEGPATDSIAIDWLTGKSKITENNQ